MSCRIPPAPPEPAELGLEDLGFPGCISLPLWLTSLKVARKEIKKNMLLNAGPEGGSLALLGGCISLFSPQAWVGIPGSKIQVKARVREKGRIVECGEQYAGAGAGETRR